MEIRENEKMSPVLPARPICRCRKSPLGLVLLCFITCFAATDGVAAENAKPSLDEALAQLKVPPAWFDEVKVQYDTNQPWKDARLEVRRLLSLNQNREAIKLTVLYVRKGDIGDGHEYPMYLYMGGEYAWAVQEYRKRLASRPKGFTHEYLCLAACYRHFGQYADALALLDVALQRLPDPPWRIAQEADIYDYRGDLYAEMGNCRSGHPAVPEGHRLVSHFGSAVWSPFAAPTRGQGPVQARPVGHGRRSNPVNCGTERTRANRWGTWVT